MRQIMAGGKSIRATLRLIGAILRKEACRSQRRVEFIGDGTKAMLIGVPKEIKDNEFRVGLIPSSVQELVHHGHQVAVQAGAGLGAGLSDADYKAAGATIIEGADRIFGEAE